MRAIAFAIMFLCATQLLIAMIQAEKTPAELIDWTLLTAAIGVVSFFGVLVCLVGGW